MTDIPTTGSPTPAPQAPAAGNPPATPVVAATPAVLDAAIAGDTTLEGQLDALAARPDFALVPWRGEPGDPEREIAAMIDEYRAIPQGRDRQALGFLVGKMVEIGQRRTLSAAEQRQASQENQRRTEKAKGEIRAAVETFATRADVDLDYFWAKVPLAERELPAELAGPAKTIERFAWVAKRAITLARASLQRAALASTPAAAPAAPAAERPKTFVDQIRAQQDRTILR